MHKIKVINVNQLNVNFDMISDGLPESGDYHLVPVGQEHIFEAELRKKRQEDIIAVKASVKYIRKEFQNTIDTQSNRIKALEGLLKGDRTLFDKMHLGK